MTENLSLCATIGRCLCCAIAAGRAPAHIVHRDERLVAFLDLHPIRPGHLQIVPRDHFPHFNALPPGLARELLGAAERFAEAQRKLFKFDRVGFLFPAAGVSHAQIHAVPLLSAADVTSRRSFADGKLGFPALPRPSEEELASTASALRETLLRTVDNSVGWRPHQPLPSS